MTVGITQNSLSPATLAEALAGDQGLFELAPEALLLLDPFSDRLLAANAVARRLMSVDDAAIPLPAVSVVLGREFSELVVFTQCVLEQGEAWSNRLRLRARDGREREVECRAVKIVLDGQTRLMASIRDLRLTRRPPSVDGSPSVPLDGPSSQRLRHAVASMERQQWALELENASLREALRRARAGLPDSEDVDQGSLNARNPVVLITEKERRERDRQLIVEALKASGGKVFGPGGAAELMAIKPTTLASRIKRWGIEVPRDRA